MNIWKKPILFLAAIVTTLSISGTALAADYIVVSNDSLFKIGQLFNTSVTTLKTDNALISDMIYPGQILNVPAELYTVISGDTLFFIAQRYSIPLTSLMKANNKWDSLLIPGQKLILPGVKPTTLSASNTVIPYTKEDLDLLARLINAEAGGESYEAMVAVGGVVVNRVKSKDWPNNISTVINQVIGEYYQFTPVKNGYIKTPATDASLRAAWACLYGSDPSKGAIFFFDNTSTNQWLWSKTITARIDSMIFAK